MPLPPLPPADSWIPQDAADQTWQAGAWTVAVLPEAPGRSLRRLRLEISDPGRGAAFAWHGLAEALPAHRPTAAEIAATLARHRLPEATALLDALVRLAADRLARIGAPEGELIVHPGGADVRPWPIRLGTAALGLADAREGWSAFLEAARALGLGPAQGITGLSGRHMPLAPRPLSAHARLALLPALAPWLEARA